MTSNVYSKNEILEKLSAKGFFVDIYTLNTFFEKWKVEAIFEDEQGCEFYDTNALDLVLNNLFNSKNEEENNSQEQEEEPRTLRQVEYKNDIQMPQGIGQIQSDMQYQRFTSPKPMHNIDPETNRVLNSISLSDGSSLMNRVQENPLDDYTRYEAIEQEAVQEYEPAWRLQQRQQQQELMNQEKKIGILEGALMSTEEATQKTEGETLPSTEVSTEASEESTEIDDMSLLSESLDAQEKFRDYIVSELSKKNMDVTPKNNEFKLDISERTLNMIARSVAKKIAKQVSQMCNTDVKANEQLAEIKEVNEQLEKKTKELEEKNKKLLLLLAESNKNLNSYQKTFFGFYKKVTPKN